MDVLGRAPRGLGDGLGESLGLVSKVLLGVPRLVLKFITVLFSLGGGLGGLLCFFQRFLTCKRTKIITITVATTTAPLTPQFQE